MNARIGTKSYSTLTAEKHESITLHGVTATLYRKERSKEYFVYTADPDGSYENILPTLKREMDPEEKFITLRACINYRLVKKRRDADA